METTQPKISSIALRYGLIAGLLVIIYSLVLLFTNLYMSKLLANISYVFLLIGIILAYRDFKSQDHGFMTYGQGLKLGSLTALITGILSGIFIYVYMKFIDSSLIEKMIEMGREEIENNPNMTEEQMEGALKVSEALTNPEMLMVFTIGFYLFFGFLMSLVVAAAMRNPRPEFE